MINKFIKREDVRLQLRAHILKSLILSCLCLTTLQLNATKGSKLQMISLEISRGTYSDLFNEIEKQSEYKFFYNSDQVDLTKTLEIKVTGSTIESVLNKVFKDTNITYKIIDNHIVLTNNHSQEKAIPQQKIRFNGKVVDLNGEPMIGVNVVLKGADKGTITDLNGNYTIEDIPRNGVLIFSYIGYLPQEVNLNQAAKVTMREDTQKLEEVIVVGYGAFKKRDLTGAVSQIKGDDIANLPLRSASDALQGKVAGVTITSTSGSPGSMGTVRIRGVGTINDNNPLYVVDGLPQTDIGWLNVRDIESMEVLKDASAQAIYGARASNGVILISTKRGAKGDTYKSNIEFDMSIGLQSAPKKYDMLDAAGFMEYKNRAYTAAGKDLMGDFATTEKREQILTFLGKNGGREGTNWWDETTRSASEATMQTYNLAFTGGTSKLRYRSSFGYMHHLGILKGSDYERLSGRINLDSQVTNWLTLSSNVGVISESRRNIQENDAYTATVFNTVTADPITPVYRNNLVDIPDFLYARIMGGYEPTNPWSQYTGVIYSNKSNSVAQVDRMSQSKWSGTAIKSDVVGEIKILPSLTFKSSIAVDLSRGLSAGFTPKYYLDGDEYSTYATVSRTSYNTDYWVFDNYFTFNKKFDLHTVNAMAGTSAEKNRYEYISASKQGMVNNDENQRIIDAGTLNPGAGGSISIQSLNSYFGRLFYSYADKYMVTGNIRWDGSSAFAKGNKWGVFPSVSTGWNFAEEDFVKQFNILSQGKLRAAWGEIGNQNLSNTSGAYLNTYGNGSYYIFGDPYTTVLGGGRAQVGNPDLKWETTRQVDFGLDLAFLNGSLRTSFDYYDRKTSDMLVQVPVPSSIGLPNTPWMNAGSVSNRGFEVTVGYDGSIEKDFKYTINGNISTYKNEVKSLGGGTNIPGTGVHLGNQTYTMIEPGKPIGYFYGFKTDGVFQTQAEVDNYINNGKVVMPSAKAGDLKFQDLNGDGTLDEKDRTMIGNPHPDFTFGLTLGAEYKGFDFSAFFQGSVGNDILNILKYDIYSGTGWYNAPKDILTTFWNGQGSTNKNFSIDANSRMNLEMSQWFIEDGSYVRLKNIQLGYTIPSSFTKKLTISNLRVFVAAQNLFTITGYSGLDPEIGNNSPQYMGIDMGFYPQARTCMFGISMKL